MSLHLDSGIAHLEAALLGDDVVTSIATDVWDCFLGTGTELPLLPAFEPITLEAGHYLAMIAITGAWTGQVVLELAVPAAERAARLMLAVPDESQPVRDADVADAVGELVNMIGGNLKGLVPAPSALSLPLVLRGDVAASSGRTVLTADVSFSWADDPVRISVWEATPSSE